ncbi:hypothetical protein D4764_0279230, partial [Takifugu flavidus]
RGEGRGGQGERRGGEGGGEGRGEEGRGGEGRGEEGRGGEGRGGERRGEEGRGEEDRVRGEERRGGEGRGGEERREGGERREERRGEEDRVLASKSRKLHQKTQEKSHNFQNLYVGVSSETFAWLVHSHQDCMLDMAGYFGLNILLWAGIVTLASRPERYDREKIYSSDKTSLDISDLKPCTSYRHRLSLTLQHGVIDCNQTENTTATLQPKKGSPHQYKSLTELEPYADYSCAANVTRGTVSMRTQDVDIRIDCNLIIYECSKSNVLTNTSMNLHWNLTSSVCKDLFTRFNFSYDCYCDNHVKDYMCGINVKYKKFSTLDRVFHYRTEPGIPETPRHLKLDVHEHNQITVKVDKISRFNGPSEFYIVRLYEGKTHKETMKGTKPSFVFKGLSYSTEYTVQASTFNGYFESSPYTRTTSTSYTEPAVIRSLVFLIITSGLLIVVAYKIYTRRRKRSR